MGNAVSPSSVLPAHRVLHGCVFREWAVSPQMPGQCWKQDSLPSQSFSVIPTAPEEMKSAFASWKGRRNLWEVGLPWAPLKRGQINCLMALKEHHGTFHGKPQSIKVQTVHLAPRSMWARKASHLSPLPYSSVGTYFGGPGLWKFHVCIPCDFILTFKRFCCLDNSFFFSE